MRLEIASAQDFKLREKRTSRGSHPSNDQDLRPNTQDLRPVPMRFPPYPAEPAHEREVRLARRARLFHMCEEKCSNKSGSNPAFKVSLVEVASQQVAELAA